MELPMHTYRLNHLLMLGSYYQRHMRQQQHKSRGFTLIELSIVLVIIGLIVGGVLVGRDLIRAAEISAVITEFSKYSTAVATFRGKYDALPGDMKNATLLWGKDVARCNTASGSAGSPGTCNGDSNGTIEGYGEDFRAWQHLAMAGMIEGSYTGIDGGSNGFTVIPGTNVPRSKIRNAGWALYGWWGWSIPTPQNVLFEGYYEGFAQLGGQVSNHINYAIIFKPDEAWKIDNKIDDGKPGVGKVRATEQNIDCYLANGTALNDERAAIVTYNLVNTTIACNLYLQLY